MNSDVRSFHTMMDEINSLFYHSRREENLSTLYSDLANIIFTLNK